MSCHQTKAVPDLIKNAQPFEGCCETDLCSVTQKTQCGKVWKSSDSASNSDSSVNILSVCFRFLLRLHRRPSSRRLTNVCWEVFKIYEGWGLWSKLRNSILDTWKKHKLQVSWKLWWVQSGTYNQSRPTLLILGSQKSRMGASLVPLICEITLSCKNCH